MMAMETVALALVLFLVQGGYVVHAYPEGAPAGSCSERGFARHDAGPQTSTSPFEVVVSTNTYSAGSTIDVTLQGKNYQEFEGFVLFATREDGKDTEELIGSFTGSIPNKVKILDWYKDGTVTNPQNCATQSDEHDFESVTLTWKAPDVGKGTLVFRATALTTYETFWVDIQSEPITTAMPDTSDTYDGDATNTVPTIDLGTCGSSQGCALYPDGCDADCDFAVTFSKDAADGTYQFQILGKVDGYVSIGFSTDDKMGKDETYHCIALSGGPIAFHRGVSPDYENWRLSKTGISNVEVALEDGFVKCSFKRVPSLEIVDVESGDGVKTFDLDSDKYYLQVAWGHTWGESEYADKHEVFPLMTIDKVDFSSNKVVELHILPNLIRQHGLFGLIGWMTLGSIGLIFARYFRTECSKVSCKCPGWLGGHINLLIQTAVWVVVSIIIIFVWREAWTPSKSAVIHAVLGLVSLAMALTGIISGFVRPGHSSKFRVFFNWGHRIWGVVTWLLGIVCCFLGISVEYIYPDLFDIELIILVVWLIVQIAWIVLLEILTCCQNKGSSPRVVIKDGLEIEEPGGGGGDSSDTIKKIKYACFVGFFLTQVAFLICAGWFLFQNEF